MQVPTGAPSPTPVPLQPSPTPTLAPAGAPQEPVETAAAVRLASWSPGGEWLAYWGSTADDVSGDFYPSPPGELNFWNARSGQTCKYTELVATDENHRLDWLAEDEALAVVNGGSFQGEPCAGDFVPAQGTPQAGPVADPALSPGEEYRAETMVQEQSAGILRLRTNLLALPDIQVINSVEWQIDERLGALGLGGEWLAGNQFLIFETLGEGPLLATVSGQMVPIARDLFGIQALPSLLGPEGYNLRADGAAMDGTDDVYHLALYGVGSEAGFPPVRFYHSETGEVEEMPFQHLWSPAFSPDGAWLLLEEHTFQDGNERRALWTRPVDPPGSPVQPYPAGWPVAWSPDWTRAAVVHDRQVSIYTFPGGQPLGDWSTGRYSAQELRWAPDGRSLAVPAAVPEAAWQQALFVITPP